MYHQGRRRRQTARKTPAEGIRGLPEDQRQTQSFPHRSHPRRFQKALGRKELRRHRRRCRSPSRVRHPGRSQPPDVLRPRLDKSVRGIFTMCDIDWISDFCNLGLLTPISIKEDCKYYPVLENKLTVLSEMLAQDHAPEAIQTKVKNISDCILDSMQLYYRGSIDDAQRKIYSLIKDISKRPLAISDIQDSVSLSKLENFIDDSKKPETVRLFHARLSDKVVDYSSADMLHIPFSLRDRMRPQRFSIPGLPCYYLSTTSLCCWYEMGRPPENQFNVSAIQLDGKFRILNLGISSQHFVDYERFMREGKIQEEFDNPDSIFFSLFCLRVLAIATSFRVNRSDENAPFKSEYVISQLIMLAAKKLAYDGLAYLSKRYRHDTVSIPFFANLALFAPYDGEEKYSKMIDRIKLSEPINYSAYKQKRQDLLMVDPYGVIDSYYNTVFYLFDDYLWHMPRRAVEIGNGNEKYHIWGLNYEDDLRMSKDKENEKSRF